MYVGSIYLVAKQKKVCSQRGANIFYFGFGVRIPTYTYTAYTDEDFCRFKTPPKKLTPLFAPLPAACSQPSPIQITTIKMSNPINNEETTCACCSLVKKEEDMAGLCDDREEYYCQACVDASHGTHCDNVECDVHWGEPWFVCEGCQKFINGEDEPGEICFKRGCYCDMCYLDKESIEACRKKGCEMCATLYEIEIEDWWRCQACNERKPDVDESVLCGDCRQGSQCDDCLEKEEEVKPPAEEKEDWEKISEEYEANYKRRVLKMNQAYQDGKSENYEILMADLFKEAKEYRAHHAKMLEKAWFG